jgi:hypothetical protein
MESKSSAEKFSFPDVNPSRIYGLGIPIGCMHYNSLAGTSFYGGGGGGGGVEFQIILQHISFLISLA